MKTVALPSVASTKPRIETWNYWTRMTEVRYILIIIAWLLVGITRVSFLEVNELFNDMSLKFAEVILVFLINKNELENGMQ